MSVEQARALIEKVTSDPEFAQRLESAPIDQRRAIIEEAGFGDIRLRHMSAALPQSAGGELSDEEFASVAGGRGTETGVTVAFSVVTGSMASGVVAVSVAVGGVA